MTTAFAPTEPTTHSPNRNAAKHNCTSKLLILPDESHTEFSTLHASLIAEYQPATEMQNQTVDEAARAVWELRRINREFDKTQKKLYAQQPNMSDWTPPQHAEYERMLRYRTRAERTHNRTLKSLEYLRTLRLRAEQRAFWETIQLSKLDISERRLQLMAERFQEEQKQRENKEKLRKEKAASQNSNPARPATPPAPQAFTTPLTTPLTAKHPNLTQRSTAPIWSPATAPNANQTAKIFTPGLPTGKPGGGRQNFFSEM